MAVENRNQTILETYIVHVKMPDAQILADSGDISRWYLSFLPKSISSLHESSRIIHSYRNVANGFAARLTPSEVSEMEKNDKFISARPQKIYTLHTTHAPSFLGLHMNFGAWPVSNYGKNVIIGVIDTGITPNHPSFSDNVMPPPPAKWKGKCELNGTVCNNKLIGARNFVTNLSGLPPVDQEGHGTLTASTAAGNFVSGANVFGNANGTAAGMAPLAHLAVYKACSLNVCGESDILAAMDAAVEDGVDVISSSLSRGPSRFSDDGVAIAAFAAIQKGIFVSCSADNGGPNKSTLASEFPWVLTVGASTIDRSLRAIALLGNGDEFEGESIFQPKDFEPGMLPLIDTSKNGNQTAGYCGSGALNGIGVKGKAEAFAHRQRANGEGRRWCSHDPGKRRVGGYSVIGDTHVIPAAHVSYAAGQKINAYVNSTSTPTATIVFKGTIIGTKSAPMVASFSSRGPSLATPGILKPDIIGPGVSILAAWHMSMDNKTNGKTNANFNMASGTSISCPHLSGIAALVKNVHPDWSPAAIKSALMTSAYQINLNGSLINDERLLPADVFAIGAGHVNPPKALDPGLVYDITPDDYIAYLCGLGYTEKEIAVITRRTISCHGISIPEAQLNYPSFSIQLGMNISMYSRTVTNVGTLESIYYLKMESVPGVDIAVQPAVLSFTEVNQKMTYRIFFSRSAIRVNVTYVQGSIAWISSKHIVRSPISVKFV
ncbi:hypothetical protein DH2020_028674 [Rehmannia glutinosa]|uniref:Uncharacterized protein n=1 Tax=Rehmannia glutinosa TaxID=99300 RepID=A0ABR0VU19_REHGL